MTTSHLKINLIVGLGDFPKFKKSNQLCGKTFLKNGAVRTAPLLAKRMLLV